MEGIKNSSGTDVAGLNKSAARTVRGAISFNSSTHLPPCGVFSTVKPVMLLLGRARLAVKPLATGSETCTNTTGIVCVSRASALITGVVSPRIASGRKSTSSFANVPILAAFALPQRSSIRRLLPSVQCSLVSAPRNVATRDCVAGSLSGQPISTPISRIRSPCCACAASGQKEAEPATTLMKSRRRIAFLEAWDHAGCVITAGIYDWRNGLQGSVCTAAIPSRRCPLWVKSRHQGISNQCPLYPRKRTFRTPSSMSVICSKADIDHYSPSVRGQCWSSSKTEEHGHARSTNRITYNNDWAFGLE